MADQEEPMPIAIVGMSCRLPGDVSTPGEFYRMLCRMRTGWGKVPSDRFNAEAYNHPNPDKKGTFNSKGGYFLQNDLSMFDASFFEMTKKEAESMDPAQRLLLECAYEALEHGGIPRESISGKKVGVFVGGNYGEHRTSNFRDLDTMPSFDATGNQPAFLAGRLAYFFNLRGPTYTVDTACSSSMHAVHLAVQSIRSGESEQAIVGASHLITQPDVWVSMAKLRLFSDAGKTHAFDHRAKSGYARGEGAGCLVLKPLAQAEKDNDHIYSVIHHSGISHNGRTVGIVAPSPEEQEQLLRDVFAQAKIDPRDVGFFEAHGTGTKKGDPIEATAIYKAVGSHFTKEEPLYIGSSKPSVGHLECASGIVSVIKAVLMLYYGFILPNADFEAPNEAIPFDEWNMKVATSQRPWPSKRKFVCVNNFGFSGSNSTCVLRAPPANRRIELAESGAYAPQRLFVLSGNDETALRASMSKLGIWLEQHAELYQTTMPRNLSYTLCQRRSHLPWRIAIVDNMCSGLAGGMNSHDVVPMRASNDSPKLAFVFTGQGAQWWGMGRELLQSHPVFNDAIDRADATLRSIGADFSIREELCRDKKTTRVGQAHISQPICSAVQLALVDLLTAFGIRPSAVTGHSSGEIGAAYAAGALTFEGAMAAAYYRGQVIVELKKTHPDLKGSMMAVGAGADDLEPMLKEMNSQNKAQVVVACENSPSSTTLSGDEEAVDRVAKVFAEQGVFNRKLFVDVAYHSPHMKLIAESYINQVSHIKAPTTMGESRVEFYSSLKGKKIDLSELTPDYWVDNLTQAVRFSTSLQELVKGCKPDILVEVGPHAALKGPIMQILKKVGSAASKISYLSTLVRDQDAARTVLDLAGKLFTNGYDGLDFFQINHNREEYESPDVVAGLYSYPWTRQKYWYESRINKQHRLKPFARHDLLGTLADWSSDLEPTWRNVFRTEDLPWLKEYQVQEQMVFPVAGYLSMAIEAATQRAKMRGVEAGQFEIKDVRIENQMWLDDGVDYEVMLSVRPTQGAGAGADEFRITSYEASRGWLEHCVGVVRADPTSAAQRRSKAASTASKTIQSDDASSTDVSLDSASDLENVSSATSDSDITSEPSDHPSQMHDKLNQSKLQSVGDSGESIYKSLAELGLSYPKAFQTMVDMSANETEVVANLCARETVSDMPMEFETPYKLHPSILDAMLQLPLLSLAARAGDETSDIPHLPCAIRHVNVSSRWKKQAGESFCAHSNVEARSGCFMVEAFSSPSSGAASISIAGLQLRPLEFELPESEKPRELCFQFNWEPIKQTKNNSTAGGDASKSGASVVIVAEKEDRLVTELSSLIAESTGSRPQVSSLDSVKEFSNSRFIVLSELDNAILPTIKAPSLEQVKKLLTQSTGVMWVTRGATRFPTNPDANMALGIVRTARSEMQAVAATLDLDPKSKLDSHAQAVLIQDAFFKSVIVEGEDAENAEKEFAEEDGNLVVPRIAVDAELNMEVHRELGPSDPYLQNFYQGERRMKMVASAYGDEDFGDIYFEDMEDTPLGEEEVEIAVAASSISEDDIESAEQQSLNALRAPSARGCSGTVTRVGRGVRQCEVGSRVSVLAEGAFGTHVRARMTSVVPLPANLSFEAGASIPTAFAAAYYALSEVARVRSGDRILVQLSGPVGVAAIEVARHLGTTAFVLIQNDNESNLARRLGVPRDHVLDARSIYLRRQLDEATKGEGMQVVLSTSGSETAKAWECLADFGRFVEIRTSEAHQVSRPELGSSATFTSVSMGSLAAARPNQLQQTLKTVMEAFAAGALTPFSKATLYPVSDLSKALQAIHQGAVHPIVLVADKNDKVRATHRKDMTIFRSDGTHVIVGGTGGLGRSMAKYMVEHGARNIVLLSRSGGGADIIKQLQQEIQCPDARILVKKCDASIESQVQQLVSDCAKELPPICGVIHAAMVLRDVLLESMAYDEYEQVIRPKVSGTLNMHNILAAHGAKLDYFVVLSSAAGILGSRGQAAYAAANTFLDSFMQYRVQNGLPGTSLDLTAVTGAGYLAENAEREEDILRNFGNEAVSEQEVLALLNAAVRGACSPQVLTGLKLHLSASGQWPYYASDPRFAELKAQCLEEAERAGLVTKKTESPGNAFRAAKSDEEAASIAGQGILQKLSEVLTISMDDLDAARNITSYGLDSLTAIELRNWIAKELRANLQILELLSSGTVNDLAALIVQKTKSA
ncbi:putative polyketide synthase [Naviculisporaceae sp. PSN 640]